MMLEQKSVNILEKFFNQFTALSYNKRKIITLADKNPSYIYFLKSGYIRVYKITKKGEELSLIILKANDLYPFIRTKNNTETYQTYYFEALTKITIYKVQTRKFNAFLKKYPTLYTELTHYTINLLDETLNKMENLVYNNAYTNVITAVITYSNKFGVRQGNKIFLEIPLTHKDIASFVGISRETTSLIMKKLENQGYIRKIGRNMLIININILKAELQPLAISNYI